MREIMQKLIGVSQNIMFNYVKQEVKSQKIEK